MLRFSTLLIGFTAFAILCSSFLFHNEPNIISNQVAEPPFANQGKQWVDSIMNKLTPRQRIGQLFMVAAYSNKPESHRNEIAKLIQNQQVGGLIFMQGGPVRQAKLTNYYQKLSNVP